MSNEAQMEYIESMRKLYREAGKFKKGVLIDQVSEFLSLSREHARKVLSGRSRTRSKRPGPSPKYGALSRKHLRELWISMGQMCSKRMKAALPLWLAYYDAPDCTPEARAELLLMSPSTIDRILGPYRRFYGRGKSTTRGSPMMRNRIPLKVLGEIIAEPGFVEADTVAHCGTSIGGDYIHSLTLTDLCTGWTMNRAIWNKKASGVLLAIQDIEGELPFTLKGFSSDNGSEFLNEELIAHFQHVKRTEPIRFVRGRPYRKNDNPHVEQKNYTHVRQLLGYHRFDDREMLVIINRLYKEIWNPLLNFFHPCQRLASKERHGARIQKKWDQPKTPYQRLMRTDSLTAVQKHALRKQFESLNPFVLQFKLQQTISLLKEMLRRSQEGKLAA